MAMLAEEAEKLYNLIAKDLLDGIVSDYPVNNRSSPYLPRLPASDTDTTEKNDRGVIIKK